MRKIAGSIVGIVVAVLILMGVERVETALYPLPHDIGFNDVDTFEKVIAGLPLSAKFILVSAWFLASFGGGWIALRLTDWRGSALIVMATMLVGGVLNAVQLPHPLWMDICAVAMPIAGAVLAIRLHVKPYPGEPLIG